MANALTKVYLLKDNLDNRQPEKEILTGTLNNTKL